MKKLIVVLILMFPFSSNAQVERNKISALYNSGNYKEAYEGYRKLLLSKSADLDNLATDLSMANSSLSQLGRAEEIDDLFDAVLKEHHDKWQSYNAVAQTLINVTHSGSIVAGKFYRGNYRSGSRYVYTSERDRVYAIQLLLKALELAKNEANKIFVSQLHTLIASVISRNHNGREGWKLQHLTDLSKIPEYSETPDYSYNSVAAPVDENGDPILYKTPESFTAAKNDGERYRWALKASSESYPPGKDNQTFNYANFLHAQFGVETLQNYGSPQAELTNETGTFALPTLKDEETIARLAIGLKRFSLPDEHNSIKIFQSLIDEQPRSGYAETALNTLCSIFTNRRQFVRAEECWLKGIREFGTGNNNHRQNSLDQIVGAWGTFENVGTQVAGEEAKLDYLFRNGKSVSFEAFEIKIETLLADMTNYLKDNPRQIDWEKVSFDQIGYQLVNNNGSKYKGEKVASWSEKLEPREKHFDKRITVKTPLKKAGAYFVTAKMAGGNETRVVLWISDMALVKKALDGGTFVYVGDAANGAPVGGAKVDFFGYRTVGIDDPTLVNRVSGRTYNVVTKDFTKESDQSGQVLLDNAETDSNYHWLITAKTRDGKLAFLGFSNFWSGKYYDYEYNQTKVFVVTDRPVYRPEQKVKFKIWIGNAKYDQDDGSLLANQEIMIQANSPTGEKFFEKSFKTDKYGAIDGQIELPKNAQLGAYSLGTPSYGMSGSFRLEEYKKPEFEVTVSAPTEPVQVGEVIKAKVSAKYYFGSPVAKGKVHYKVLRTSYEQGWYPIGIWDWFYGAGYWWFSYDYEWFPGWRIWGCRKPIPWWWISRTTPPELVAESESAINDDGTIEIKIDTGAAKELYPNDDHKYQITVEVTDESRRTIVGTGEVVAARQPFKVYSWVDKGHYNQGDIVRASFRAQTSTNKPVSGKGVLKLLKISYSGEKLVENPVQDWSLDTNTDGTSNLQITAASAGQYRLSYTLTDSAKHQVEGGYLFTVRGEGFDGRGFRFNEIELIPDKREYAPDEKVKVQINVDKPDSAVLLFVRPTNGIYLKPEFIRVSGKSAVREIPVLKKDMPNFFLEAVVINSGKVFSEVKEIVVPPEKRVLNVSVQPDKNRYKPGEDAAVSLLLTDSSGKPFSGSAAVSVYDRSVEYISGGSNVPEIRSYFWKWRRNHQTRTETSLSKFGLALSRENETIMSPLGVFGYTVADEEWERDERQDGSTDIKRTFKGRGATGSVLAARQMKKSASKEELDLALPASAPTEVLALGGATLDQSTASTSAQAGSVAQPTVRSNFADTAYWSGTILSDQNGAASFKFKMPENLTDWKIRVWAVGSGTRVGEGEVTVASSKNVLVRLQAPRFFIEKDEVVLSANVHNYLPTDKKIQAKIAFDKDLIELEDAADRDVIVKSNSETRVDWRVKVIKEGEIKVRMSALSDEESDAMEMTLPVHVHGMLKTDSFSGALRPEENVGALTVKVPAERRPEQTKLEVRYSPSLASALVDALPYLVNYPYGCTEQTLNRFLPTAITQRILQEMKLDLKAIRDKRIDLNAQEIGDATTRASQWKQYEENPVFDEEAVSAMAKAGLDRLEAMQLSDGGWGWFSGSGEHSSAHTTAYVVHGLALGKAGGLPVDPNVLQRGLNWLKNYQSEELQKLKNEKTKTKPYKTSADDLDAFTHLVLTDAQMADKEMSDLLFRDRTQLSVYSKATLGLAFEKVGANDKLQEILRNLRQYLVEDNENQTAYLKLPTDNYWWYWYGDEIETQSYYLKLLSRTEPKGRTASELAKYLINNRSHGRYWKSTRDTATAIEALADYVRASGENAPNLTVKILVDGSLKKEVKINKENLFSFDNALFLEGQALSSGEHKIEIQKSGSSPIYYNAYLTNFSLEDYIPKAGLEIKVNRKFYKLTRSDEKQLAAGGRGQAIEQSKDSYQRAEIKDLEILKSGDLVEVELELDSKNDYEYLVFEDKKPAGFEPVEVRSGYNGNELGAYVEFRDDRVNFFTKTLGRGKHSVSYRARAEIPGKFSALPTYGYGMYAPELRANSDELKIRIED